MAEPQCVQCRRRRADPEWRPFCSERCRLLDLSRWLDGGYRVAGEPIDAASPEDAHADDDEEAPPASASDPWPEPDDR